MREPARVGAQPTWRAQTEPTAALVAVFAVCVGLALYAGTLDTTLRDVGRGDDETRMAEPTLGRVYESLTDEGGIASPTRLSETDGAGPAGYSVAVTLSAGDERWRVGPASPGTASTAVRPVSVRLEPGVVVSGTLRVEVWS
ncbi:DUF7285 family protein [Haloarchaeobius sp. TZWWS8]|uniref:DUF7285 family protein n=1 Tax=Haloarchaeobius sp. TZWWS8 TaxID=3446121 RepID=UPI003EBC83AC